MSYSKVSQQCHLFRNEQMNVHEKECNGHPTVMTDGLVEKANIKNCEHWRFTYSKLSFNFPNISQSILNDIVTEKLHYENCLCWMGPEIVNRHKKQKCVVSA